MRLISSNEDPERYTVPFVIQGKQTVENAFIEWIHTCTNKQKGKKKALHMCVYGLLDSCVTKHRSMEV
jgi:hypothetical protein